MSNKIEIDKDKRKALILAIKTYFAQEREENLGDLSSALILDFFIEKIAPEFYNQGDLDSYKYMNEKIGDLLEIQKY
ncbi:MAG: DUF2164 domain-containing protein [Candidatus Gastranaerophilales bacterium]|nr:DUF2164 domain-containing protein [Candidatus Gastranaerophilales bacterium]